jgi:hypothetical protein
MNFNERGFIGIISLILTLAIICFLMVSYLKSNMPRAVPIIDHNGTISLSNSSSAEASPAVVQSARHQISVYTNMATDRVNSLLNITDQQ